MIGWLRGRVIAEEPTGTLVLDVQGVGYELTAPIGTLGRAKSHGDETELWVHTHAREDSLELFGFASEADRRVFRLLIGVPNVGPKTALGVLSAIPIDELSRAVQTSYHARLSRVPGIGKKTAERLVLELKEKLPRLEPRGPAPTGDGDASSLLLRALTHMGYRPAEAERAVKALGNRVGSEPMGELLKAALAELTP